MKLLSLPDAKFVLREPEKWFTVEQDYPIIREIGNAYVIKANNDEDVIIPKSRFED